jgi:hypothetical protein
VANAGIVADAKISLGQTLIFCADHAAAVRSLKGVKLPEQQTIAT